MNKVLHREILSTDRKSFYVVVESDTGEKFIEVNQGLNKIILEQGEWSQLNNMINSIQTEDEND